MFNKFYIFVQRQFDIYKNKYCIQINKITIRRRVFIFPPLIIKERESAAKHEEAWEKRGENKKVQEHF